MENKETKIKKPKTVKKYDKKTVRGTMTKIPDTKTITDQPLTKEGTIKTKTKKATNKNTNTPKNSSVKTDTIKEMVEVSYIPPVEKEEEKQYVPDWVWYTVGAVAFAALLLVGVLCF